jgi:hypothetical protein
MTNFQVVDYSKLTGDQVLVEYNRMARAIGLSTRKAKFETKAEGAARCQKLFAQIQAENAAKPARKVPEVRSPAPKKTKPATKVAAKDLRVIKLVPGVAGPRAGTNYADHLAAMAERPTVADYVAGFADADRRTARHWLYNAMKDGRAVLVDA